MARNSMTVTISTRVKPYAVMITTSGDRKEVEGIFNINFRLRNGWKVKSLETTMEHLVQMNLTPESMA